MDHSPDFQALIDAENKISADAEAWVRKYFVAASIARGCGVTVINGIMAKVLISRPIQANSQWLLAIVIVVPRIRLIIRTKSVVGLIDKGRGFTYIVGVWAQELN